MSRAVHGAPLVIHAEDGFPLAAHVFRPQPAEHIRSVLVTVNATGVQARFYHDFCAWAAAHGVLAFTFDYRYSGASFDAKTQRILAEAKAKGEDGEDEYDQGYEAALHECPDTEDLSESWARKDLKAVILHARDECARLLPGGVEQARHVELTLLGHSLGGHLHVLLEPEFVAASAYPQGSSKGPDTRRVNRFLTVCSGNAHWRNHPETIAARYAMEELVGRPLVEERIFRCRNMGLGFDLPYGPGTEWLEWYFHPLFSLVRPDNERRARQNTHTTPFLYTGFVDDETMGPRMPYLYLSTLDCSTSNVHSLIIDPAVEREWPRCGHVNAFQPGSGTGFTDAADEDKATRGGEAYMPSEGAAREDEARRSGAAPSSERTKTREETIWPIWLRWIVDGEIVSGIGERKTWTRDDERDLDALRAQEATAREQEARQGRRGYLTTFDDAEEDEDEQAQGGEAEGSDRRDDDDESDAAAIGQAHSSSQSSLAKARM